MKCLRITVVLLEILEIQYVLHVSSSVLYMDLQHDSKHVPTQIRFIQTLCLCLNLCDTRISGQSSKVVLEH